MGRRGPPKKPTALKLIQGTPGGAHKLNKNEPKARKAPAAEMRCPPDLSEDGKKYWKKYAPRLYRAGLLTEFDTTAFKRLCEMQSELIEAIRLGKEKGEYYPVYQRLHLGQIAKGEKPKIERLELYPHSRKVQPLREAIQRLEKEFGMTPASRSGISATPTKPEADDFESWLFGTE